MTGEEEVFCDSVPEWFPALTGRVSITTIQGNEWLPDHKFSQSVALQSGVQSCMEGPSPLSCIENYHLQYEYLYIDNQGTLKDFCRVISPISRGENLVTALKNNNQYHLTYQSNAVTVFSTVH